MIGEIGALGGGLVPNAMGLSKQYFGSYFYGFALFAGLAVAVLLMMRVMQIRWTRTWAEKGGRAPGGLQGTGGTPLQGQQELFGGFKALARVTCHGLEHDVVEPDGYVGPPARRGLGVRAVSACLVGLDSP